jgi:hypothetical protein
MRWPNHLSPCRWVVGPFLAVLALAVSPPNAAAGDEASTFAAAKAAIDAGNLQQTRTLGGHGKTAFSETSGSPGFLVGFELGLGKFFDLEVIYAVRPIYRTAQGDSPGNAHGLFQTVGAKKKRSKVTRTIWLRAKPGYAVAGITGRAGLLLNGLALTFQRLDGDKLNPNDKYQSEWVGDRTGGSEATFDSQGMLVVGIHGKESDVECSALGLLHVAAPKTVAKARPATPRRPSTPPRQDAPAPRPAEEGRRGEAVAEEKGEEKVAAPREKAALLPRRPAPRAEPRQPVEEPPAKAAEVKAAQEEPGAPVWALPALAGVLVTVVGVGGALLLTNSRQPVTAEESAVSASGATAQAGINLPEELESRVRQELTEGEELIWGGQPSPRVTRFKGLQVMGVCLLVMLFAGAMMAGVLATAKGPAADHWPIFAGCGLFILIGLGGLFVAPITQRRLAAQTAYAITNRRAIVHRPTLFGVGAVDSYGPLQLQQMVRRDWWLVRGAGDLIFATQKRLVVTTTRGKYGSSSSAREKIIHFGFLGIEDPTAVEKLIRQVLVNPLVDKIQA